MEIVSIPDDLSLYRDEDVLEDPESDINRYYGKRLVRQERP